MYLCVLIDIIKIRMEGEAKNLFVVVLHQTRQVSQACTLVGFLLPGVYRSSD